MKISIITISYNSEETIEDTILSVINQTYDNIEYIIIDGGSTDDTLNIINQYKSRINTIVSEPDKGIYDAMNKGVRLAKGELVGILNSDDFYANKNVIENIAKNIKDYDSIYADLVYVDRKNTDKIIRYWKSGVYKKDAFLKGWMPPHPTFFLKKKIYDQYGTYNLSLKSAADYELMLRMLHKENVSTTYYPETITKMRVGGQSNASISNRLKANKEDRKAWEINQMDPKFYSLYLKPLRKVSQFIRKK
ncbi:MAG: glycosyltransferase [Flavobacteriales bacterium]|nr:glycosyltransferase [Flavobacteriales bacterium]